MDKSNKRNIRVVDYIANYISQIGVKNIFMLSGTGSVYLDDALAFHKDISYICARHEAAAVTMASASSKLTGELGVVISTTGPGATNAIGGVVEAWVDSLPILIFSGQVPTSQILPDIRSFGIQGFNVIENVKKITKYSHRIDDPFSIKYHLEKAIYYAKEGRHGPVWLDLPMDVQAKLIEPKNLEGFKKPKILPYDSIDNKRINELIRYIQESKKPIIVFGQGVRTGKAIEELEKLLKHFEIPSICSRMGLDILPHSNPNFFGLGGVRGHITANSILKKSDLVIAIGTSLTHAFTGEEFELFNDYTKLVMVNVDESESNKPLLKPDLFFKNDSKSFLSNLNSKLNEDNIAPFYDWQKECLNISSMKNTSLEPQGSNPINSYFLIKCLNECTNHNHIFTNDAGSANYVSSQGLYLKKGQREITSGAFYSMGIAIPLAIGASVTDPRKQIIVVTGDGSIELNIQELRTISQNALNIKIFVINNGGYASIRKSQDEMADGRYTDDQDVLNFKNVALAFQLEYKMFDDHATLKNDIKLELLNKRPCLIEVICDPDQEINKSFD